MSLFHENELGAIHLGQVKDAADALEVMFGHVRKAVDQMSGWQADAGNMDEPEESTVAASPLGAQGFGASLAVTFKSVTQVGRLASTLAASGSVSNRVSNCLRKGWPSQTVGGHYAD